MIPHLIPIKAPPLQHDWADLLPLAEFAYNNAQNASTKMSPFYANYGYHPRYTVKVNNSALQMNPASAAYAKKLKEIHDQARANLQEAQLYQKRYYDQHTKEIPSFHVGDSVWLLRKNISTIRPSQKLKVRRLGPFKISKVVGESKLAYRLELPPHFKIHPVFHVSLLEPYKENTIPGRKQPPPPPITINDNLEYVVHQILDSRIHRGKLQYYVDWQGYSPAERTWEPASHLSHAQNAVTDFHYRYPLRPSPKDIMAQPRGSSAMKEGPTVRNGRNGRARTRRTGHGGDTLGAERAQQAGIMRSEIGFTVAKTMEARRSVCKEEFSP